MNKTEFVLIYTKSNFKKMNELAVFFTFNNRKITFIFDNIATILTLLKMYKSNSLFIYFEKIIYLSINILIYFQ